MMGALFVSQVDIYRLDSVHNSPDALFYMDNYYFVLLVLLSFMLGCGVSLTISQVIESGVATTFVCIAENPQALWNTKPDLYNQIRSTYPSITLDQV
jgi:hypothetical protein